MNRTGKKVKKQKGVTKAEVIRTVEVIKGLSADTLQESLWETLKMVKNGKMDVSQANAITSAAKEICNVTRLQVQWKALTGDESDDNKPKLIQ